MQAEDLVLQFQLAESEGGSKGPAEHQTQKRSKKPSFHQVGLQAP